MFPSVRAAWVDYNKNLEGIVPGPYADVLGLVTVGMGNKIDPVRDAIGLPWVLVGAGRLATGDEVRRAWGAVKNDPLCASRGWQYALSIPENNIRLTNDAIDDLIGSRLDSNDEILTEHFPKFQEWPADAQLAAHSMMWAMGVFFGKFPKCCAALAQQDFAGAAAECKMVPEAGTLVTRNRLNFTLFHNANDVMVSGGDHDVLIWQP